MIKSTLKLLLKLYKATLSRALGPRCRFYPSCSDYAYQCIEKYPLYTALPKASGRILRCHPWNPGGVDLP